MASSGSGTDQAKSKGPPPKGPPARKAPPAALLRQMGHATNRIDDASSTCSWTRVDDEPTQPSNLPRVKEEGLGEQGEIPSDLWPSPPPGPHRRFIHFRPHLLPKQVLLQRTLQSYRQHKGYSTTRTRMLQLGQLAAVHAHWTATVEAPSEAEAGPRISAIAVESNPANVHLVCESPLLRKDRAIVKAEALALQCHDPLDEVVAKVMPPIVDGPAVQPAASAPRFAQALMGPAPSEAVVATPVSSEKPSVTDPGHAPGVGTFMEWDPHWRPRAGCSSRGDPR